MPETDDPAKWLIAAVTELGVAFGREDSAKLHAGGVRTGRTLLGLQAQALPLDRALALCARLGMPPAAQALLRRHQVGANALLYGVEPGPGGPMFKFYLEFWHRVHAEVARTGSRKPLLAYLGVKWVGRADWPGDTMPAAEQLRVARYICHPLRSVPECLARMAALSQQAMQPEPPGGPAGLGKSAQRQADGGAAAAIVHRAAISRPGCVFPLLQVQESVLDADGAPATGNPRDSWDINLYAAGLRVGDVLTEINAAAAAFGVLAPAREVMQSWAARPLGHLSGGRGPDGAPFLTLYAEVHPIP